MRYRKRRYEKRRFESDGRSNDVSANIYLSMMLSPAWMALTNNQRNLYVYCKLQYYAEKKKPNGDSELFTMNQAKWSKLYGLYKENNASSFYRDMAALINHGFIKCEECGKTTRTKSIYRYSDMWQKYGTDEFEISLSDMTEGMRKALRKKNKAPDG